MKADSRGSEHERVDDGCHGEMVFSRHYDVTGV